MATRKFSTEPGSGKTCYGAISKRFSSSPDFESITEEEAQKRGVRSADYLARILKEVCEDKQLSELQAKTLLNSPTLTHLPESLQKLTIDKLAKRRLSVPKAWYFIADEAERQKAYDSHKAGARKQLEEDLAAQAADLNWDALLS
jgi:hypothetical protein